MQYLNQGGSYSFDKLNSEKKYTVLNNEKVTFIEGEEKIVEKKILQSLKSDDDISYDTTPKSKFLILELSKTFSNTTIDYSLLNTLSELIKTSNSLILIRFLILISHLDTKYIDLTRGMAICSLYSYKDDFVKEALLETIEAWEWEGAINYLSSMEDFKRPYLNKYRDEIINNLKGL